MTPSLFDQGEELQREPMRSVEDVRAELDNQYGDYFSFALRVVVKNQAHADRWRDKENETGVVLYHFAKAVNLLDATRRLCHDGFAREAIATSRSLFNLFINLRWLTKPGVSSQRLQRFADHEKMSKANNAKTLIERKEDLTEEQKQKLGARHRKLSAQIRKIRPDAEPQGKGGMYPNWHPGIQEMAKDVDLLSDYHNTYKRLSQTEHTDPESVREYLKEDNGGALMHGDVGPSTEYAPLVIIDSIRYFLNVKRDAAPLLGFEESQEELTEHGRLMGKYADSFAGC